MSHHVHQRGNNRQDIFHDDMDRMVFIAALVESSEKYHVRIHVWTFMDNHVHLVVTPETPDGLPRTMKHVGGRYVPYFNRKYGRTGTLWGERYKSHLIHTELYWFRCLRYVEFNRVRAGLVDAPHEYRWSSYHSHALGQADPLVTHHDLYLNLGRTPAERQMAYRALCGTPLTDFEVTAIRNSLRTGECPCEPPALTSLVTTT